MTTAFEWFPQTRISLAVGRTQYMHVSRALDVLKYKRFRIFVESLEFPTTGDFHVALLTSDTQYAPLNTWARLAGAGQVIDLLSTGALTPLSGAHTFSTDELGAAAFKRYIILQMTSTTAAIETDIRVEFMGIETVCGGAGNCG